MGDLLRKSLEREGLTQMQFAIEMGVSLTTVNSWVNGHKFPRRAMLDRMEQRFGWNLFGVGERASNTWNPQPLADLLDQARALVAV